MKVEFYLKQIALLLSGFIAPLKYYECYLVLWCKAGSAFINLVDNVPSYDKSLILIYIPLVF